MKFQYVEFSKYFCPILYYLLALLLAKPVISAKQMGIKLPSQVSLSLAMARYKDFFPYWNLSPTYNSIIAE